MTRVKATGTFLGAKLTVECTKEKDDLTILFDGMKDEATEDYLYELLSNQFPVAGTYSPEPESMLNVLNVLSYRFFDDEPEIETEGEFEEMPYEEGVIY